MSVPSPSRIQIHRACKRFGEGPFVLENIDLEVRPSDFIGIIGPSGCGKTTLLRLLAGLTPCTEGSLNIDGLDPDHVTHEMAYVFQDSTLLPWHNVAQNARLLLRLAGVPREESQRRSREALRLVRLEGLEKRYPRQLSGGQRMRVSLARALSVSPRLLLLDEPFGALDEMTREHLNEELLAIRQQNPWTAFFVTHSVAEAVFLSSRILILTAPPGRMHAIIDVPFPYPRTAETRLSPDFLSFVAQVSRKLRSVDDPSP